MMFLLDTNVVSELRRRRQADPNLVAWASGIPVADQFLSVITIMEVETGILLLARRDPDRAGGLRQWLEAQLLPSFAGRLLPVDTAVARRCAALHAPQPRPQRDALIAATALAHRMTVVTRNVADFMPMGVPVLNPWDHPRP
ncbi:MAG TPA: type II toxin-antitoxin system VapC family toxin [Alphaproteobacteria bacterium]|nr:type II toxin-antitoxin system VapC family toxin [Alphaproteobacteria bacterium]